MEIQTIPLTLISPNPNQPRKHFDANSLRDLADSITEHGILQPIVVRPADGGRYEIIAGERRYRASQLAGAETIPAIVRIAEDDEAFILATLENVARRDMKPIEEAKAYALIRDMGRTVDEIAALVGKATFAVAWRLELLNLAPEYQDIDLPLNVARLLARISIEGQRSVMRRYMAGEFKTAPECERFCNAVIAREAQVDMFAETELDAFGADQARRERARQHRNAIKTAWEKALGLSAAFGAFDEASDQEIADALDGDIELMLAQARQLEAHVRRTRIRMENAQALQRVEVA